MALHSQKQKKFVFALLLVVAGVACVYFRDAIRIGYKQLVLSCNDCHTTDKPKLNIDPGITLNQNLSPECNKALTKLLHQNSSQIYLPSETGLTNDCLTLLLNSKVKFADEATRIRLLSQSVGPYNTTHCFRRAILETEKQPIRERLSIVKKAFEKSKVPLILDGGTLIGSYRHHGFVPWDDDLDFRVTLADYNATFQILSDLAKQYPKMFRFWPWKAYVHWKLIFLNLPLQKAESKNYELFIDIFFVKNPSSKPSNRRRKPRGLWSGLSTNQVFPLTIRPFEGLWFASPRDSISVMQTYYGDALKNCHYRCYSNPKSVNFCSKGSLIPCRKLESVYPFVKRIYLGDTGASLEFLMLSDYLLQVAFLSPRENL